MIYSITNEQPFQVLSTNFSISPSESGYNLQISANGIDYTDFATVGAGVTRQFTGMANGNFYRLSGNTGTVEVNWMRECSPAGGGGGGGYVLPTATASRLGGVKIGSGINVASDGTISANGGGKTVVNLDSTTQAERATLYTALKALYDGGSGNTINDTYVFYKTINSNQGVPFDYYEFDSANTLILGAVVTSGNSTAYEQVLKIASDGSVTVSTNTVGGGSGQFIIVDFDAMTQQERADLVTALNALDNGGSGSTINQTYQFYRNISGPDGNNWYGARVQFYRTYYGRCVFGAMLTETDAQEHIPARTFEVNMWLAGDGSWEATNVYKFEAPSTKVVGLSQAEYDALVQAGTVDANTLYIII